jgi:glutathione synthase
MTKIETPQTTLDSAAELAQEGLEFAMAHGLVRYRKDGSIGHLPFTLHPWQTPPGFYAHGSRVSPLYNKLYHRVSQERTFLDEHLAASRAVDDFVQGLYSCLPERPIPRPWRYLSRHDFMPALTPAGVLPKQVETNLMAASLGYASQRVNAAIRFLYAGTELGRKVLPHRGGSTICKGLALAYKHYAQAGEVILFLVPPGEVNAFDQRTMQAELVLDYDIPVLRTTLNELGESGEIRNGKVVLKGKSAAIAYFRAGYSPDHYNDAAWKGRRLLEHSQTLSIPSVTIQLANTKKIQQVLANQATLEQFVTPQEASQLLETMVTMCPVDGPLQGSTGREVALADPEGWVLKPSREGGGNNYFGEEMVQHLKELTAQQAQAFILMEAIRQEPFRAVRLVEEKVVDNLCVTELGHFSYALWDEAAAEPAFQDTEGYLLRTKDLGNREGLVLGGFSFLDTAAVD